MATGAVAGMRNGRLVGLFPNKWKWFGRSGGVEASSAAPSTSS